MNEKIEELLAVLKDIRKYIQVTHDDAEARHDSYGDFFMDSELWDTMIETENLLGIIDSFDTEDKI